MRYPQRMAGKKKSTSKKAANFVWNPASYQVAADWVQRARDPQNPMNPSLVRMMIHAIGTMGGLTCPAPDDDPGTYRVHLDAGSLPEIQKRDDAGDWASCP